MPDPRFLKDMGVASIIAGIVLLGLSRIARKFK
jgi:hypothetical protein